MTPHTHLSRALGRALMITALSASLTISSGLKEGQAEVVDRIVALVNDSVITLSELEELMLPLEMRLQSIPDPRKRAQILREQRQIGLDQLIGQRLLLQVAQEQGISVQDEQVEAHLKSIMARQGWDEATFQQYLAQQGIKRETVKAQSRDFLLQQSVAQRNLGNKISVSEIDLQSEYRAFLSEVKSRKQVEGAHLFLQVAAGSTPAVEAAVKQRATELLNRAKNGEDFSALVREFGQGSSAKSGGDLGVISRGGGLPSELEEAFLQMSEGELRGPVRSPFGYHVLKVRRTITAPAPSFEEVKPKLEMTLRQQKYEQALKAWIEELKGSAFVERRL